MAARPSWTVWCDCCGGVLSGGDLSCTTAAEGRDVAKRTEGAHVALPGGRDICGECWAEGAR